MLWPSGSRCVVRGRRISDGRCSAAKPGPSGENPRSLRPQQQGLRGGQPEGPGAQICQEAGGLSAHLEVTVLSVPLVLTVKRNETGSAVPVVFTGVYDWSYGICWNSILS